MGKMKDEQRGQLGGPCCLLTGGGGGEWFPTQDTAQLQLSTLRSFRDDVLRKHRTGVLFARAYYGFSSLTVPHVKGYHGFGKLVSVLRSVFARIAKSFGIKPQGS